MTISTTITATAQAAQAGRPQAYSLLIPQTALAADGVTQVQLMPKTEVWTLAQLQAQQTQLTNQAAQIQAQLSATNLRITAVANLITPVQAPA